MSVWRIGRFSEALLFKPEWTATLMDDRGSLSHTTGLYASASRKENAEFISVPLTRRWNAVRYSECKAVYQNLSDDKPFFPSACPGKNHRLGGNLSKFLYSVSLFTSFYYTNCFLSLTCQRGICYLYWSQCTLVCVTLWLFSANILGQIFLPSFT